MHIDRADPVCRLADLQPVDAHLVTTFRNWATGLRDGHIQAWVAVWEGFVELVGPARAPEMAEHFETLMQTLGHHARRTIHFHAPDCPCVDADETAFIELLCAASGGHATRAHSCAAAFVQPDGVSELLARAREMTRVLAACDCAPLGVRGRLHHGMHATAESHRLH